MIWNFISWVLIITAVVAIFFPDKLALAKKFIKDISGKQKK